MCDIMKDLRREVERTTNIRIARKLITLGKLTQKEIEMCTGLSLQEIQKLIEENDAITAVGG